MNLLDVYDDDEEDDEVVNKAEKPSAGEVGAVGAELVDLSTKDSEVNPAGSAEFFDLSEEVEDDSSSLEKTNELLASLGVQLREDNIMYNAFQKYLDADIRAGRTEDNAKKVLFVFLD